jgi:hypothetical protein
MYAAVLREDWTRGELAAIEANPKAQKLLEKMRASVWYPALLQLVKYHYAPDALSEDERRDIAYHLETDCCKRSLRLTRWCGAVAALGRLASRVQHGDPGATEELEKKLAKIASYPMPLGPAVVPAGLAQRDKWSQRVISEDGQTQATFSRDERSTLWLALEDSSKPAGTLLRIAIVDDEGTEVWQSFVMLHRIGKLSVGKVRLDIELRGNCTLISELRDAVDMVAADATALRAAFANAQEDELASVTAWHAWAKAVRSQTPLHEAIRRVVLEMDPGLRIACLDLAGTIVDHERHGAVRFMPELLRALCDAGWQLKIITRWGRTQAERLLIPVCRTSGLPAPEIEILSGPDKERTIRNLLGSDVREVVFIDDKPANVRAVAELKDSRLRVIGFLGSGKYANEAGETCREIGVAFAATARDLAEQLGVSIEADVA